MKTLKNNIIIHITSYLLLVLFIAGIFSVGALQYSVENFARDNARNIANGIAQCIDIWIKSGGTNYQNIAYECGAFHRSEWPTGDFFIVDLSTNMFIYDGNPDYSKDGWSRAFSYSWECSLHSDTGACQKAIDEMKKGYSSRPDTMLSWRFDDSDEWLEWVIIPGERLGYDWPIGLWGIKKANKQFLVVVGTQSDEVDNHFYTAKISIALFLILWIILWLLSHSIINKCSKQSSNT